MIHRHLQILALSLTPERRSHLLLALTGIAVSWTLAALMATAP
ncbi:MAG TPA: hypothetical protein VEQ09_03940 [Aquabacterium sp.]|nr:hypothetical protein [Aquabacterium sp.]